MLRFIQVKPEDVVDVFVYVAVLNLAIEYLPAVISESFTLSLLTAVLLKLSLELVLIVKAGAMTRFRGAMTARAKLTAALLLWATAAGSKIVVLELVNLVFGGRGQPRRLRVDHPARRHPAAVTNCRPSPLVQRR
jgi:hypothetical protein